MTELDIQVILMCVAVLSILGNLIQFILSTSSTSKKKVVEDTTKDVTLLAEMKSINSGIENIKLSVKSLEVTHKDDHDKLIRMEESLKSLHKRVDKIDGGIHLD